MKYFYDPNQFAFTKILKSQYANIKQEWQQAPLSVRQPRGTWHQGPKLEKGNGKWDVVLLMDRDQPISKMRDYFPVTMDLIDQIDIFENLAFSIFDAKTETIPHRGWSAEICRVHLAIDTNDQSALVCGDEKVVLRNSEVLVFDDYQEHYAYNHADTARTILLFDILKKKHGIKVP